MDQEDADELTDKILAGDIDAQDLDELVGLLVHPEVVTALAGEMIKQGADPAWLLTMNAYSGEILAKNSGRLAGDDYALGYFQGMMAAFNISMRAAHLLGEDGEEAYDAMEHAVNIASAKFAQARNDAWPSELEGGDYEN
jgi:hypothetical protein